MRLLLNSGWIIKKLSSTKNTGMRVLDPQFYVNLIGNPNQNIHQANRVLKSLANKRFTPDDFQQIWKKYNYYIYILYETVSTSKLEDQLKFLDYVTKIYIKSDEIKSQNLIKVFNKVVDNLLRNYKDLTLQQQISLISAISRYNIKKAKAILTGKKTHIQQQIKDLNYESAQALLQLMHQTAFIDTLLLQQSIDAIYPYLSELTVQELCSMLYYLGSSQKFINFKFFMQSVKRLVNFINTDKINDGQLMKCISSVSLIQKNMRRTALIDQLDQLYVYAITYLTQKSNTLRSRQLGTLSSIIRRSKYDDEAILQSLIDQSMSRRVFQLENVDEEGRKIPDNKLINMETLVNVFHTMGVCSLSSKRFNEYVIGIVEMAWQQFPLSKEVMSRLIWSACVLCNKEDVARLYPAIEKLYQNQTLPVHEAMNLYYCYLYLKTFLPQITAHKNCFAIHFQKQQLQSQISKSHEQVYETLLKCDVPSLKQFNISNIMVDIMIPKWKTYSNIVIDFHGYHHFLRKTRTPEGSNALKQKILKSEGYHYYYISIDQWNLAPDKQHFIQQLLNNIQQTLKIIPKSKIIIKK